MMIGISPYANEIEDHHFSSMQDVIDRETQEIASVDPTHYEELAQLYVSRGESFLLDAQYEKAIEDFQNARRCLKEGSNVDIAIITAFRATFGEVIIGEVISYDNLEMQEETQQSIQQLQIIANSIGCNLYWVQPLHRAISLLWDNLFFCR
jgi:hypothetical protein